MEKEKTVSPSSPAPRPSRPRAVKLLIFSLVPLLCLLLAGEVILRAFDFRYSDTPALMLSYPEKVSGGRFSRVLEENQVSVFMKDKHQSWVPIPSFENKYSPEKPAGVTRIGTLGCSCTQGCSETTFSYPDHMGEILNSQFPGGYQVLNAGVGSYSSFQGLQRLKHALLKYKPDLVTLYFGWNDHWIASIPDNQVRMKAAWEVGLINFLEKFRVYQAYHWVITRLKEKLKTRKEGAPPTFRVSREEYQANLNAMIDLCRANGVRPVLMTAPYDPAQLAPSPIFPFQVETLVQTHRNYNDVVRQVGAAQQVPVIDLEAAFLQLEKQQPLAYFSDGIHFTPVGCRLVAGLIVQRLQELGLVKSLPKDL